MHTLSTIEGQRRHYNEVKARLGTLRKPTIVIRPAPVQPEPTPVERQRWEEWHRLTQIANRAAAPLYPAPIGPRKIERISSTGQVSYCDLIADPTLGMKASDNIRAIVRPFLREANLTWIDMRAECRRQYLVRCRRNVAIAMYGAGLSLAQVGRIMNKDHTTIMHCVRVALGQGDL